MGISCIRSDTRPYLNEYVAYVREVVDPLACVFVVRAELRQSCIQGGEDVMNPITGYSV